MKRQILTFLLMFILCSLAAQKNLKEVLKGEGGLSKHFLKFDVQDQVEFNPRQANNLFGIEQQSDLVIMSSETDDLGMTHHRFYQTYNGILVENAMYVAHTKAGKLVSANGSIVTEFSSPLQQRAAPSLSPSQAIAAALKYVHAERYAWQDSAFERELKLWRGNKASYFPVPSQVWYSGVNDVRPEKLRLVFKVDVFSLKPFDRKFIYVDARTGAIAGIKQELLQCGGANVLDSTTQAEEAGYENIDKIPMPVSGIGNTYYSGQQTIKSDFDGSSYRLRYYGDNYTITTLNGAKYYTDYVSSSDNWSLLGRDQFALDAHFGVTSTYDFYRNQFGRNSVDGQGLELRSYVNDPLVASYNNGNPANAFWDNNDNVMRYGYFPNGNGLTAIDITAHELTHGFTQFTSVLNYSGESGAINESISDIMGKSVQFFFKPSDLNWQISNDMNWNVRDMSNPKSKGHPATYGGAYWVNVDGCVPSVQNDFCGVHSNSGVGNFMFYLLVNGGNGTNDLNVKYSVNGIGLSKADQIIYRTNASRYLTSTSRYVNWRNACITAATDLYGAASDEVAQVQNAWHAVGVGTPAPCKVPTGLQALQIQNSSALLTWAAVPTAKEYTLQWKLTAGTVWTKVPNITTVSYNLSNLASGTSYSFRVLSTCANGSSSSYGDAFAFTTAGPACNPPSMITFPVISSNAATISWAPVPNALSYTLQWKQAAAATWTVVPRITTTSCSLTSLAPGTTYTFQILTMCPYGTGLFGTPINFTTECGMPAGLSATSVSGSSAVLAWYAITGVKSYTLQWKSSIATTWTRVSNLTTNFFNLTGRTPGTTYMFRVATNCNNITSSYSAPVNFTTTCITPTGLYATEVTSTSALLKWNSASGASKYSLLWKRLSDASWNATKDSSVRSAKLTDLVPATTYVAMVYSKCSNANSVYSSQVSFTTLCSAPTGLAATDITSTSARLKWTPIAGISGYTIQWKPSTGGMWTVESNLTDAFYNLNGLTSNVAYQFQVKSICNGKSSSNYSSAISFTPKCFVPIGAKATNITSSSAQISWSSVPGAKAYTVQWKRASDGTWTIVPNISMTSYNLAGLTTGVTYQFQVRTDCSATTSSSFSSTVKFTPECYTPQDLVATNITATSASISWGMVPGAKNYSVQWKKAGGVLSIITGISTNSYNLTNLTPGTSYSFQVLTGCDNGNSSYSSFANFTTVCGTPSGLIASNITSNNALLSWSAVAGASNYTLQWKQAAATQWTTVRNLSTLSYNLTSAKPGTSYTFQVSTVCHNGSSDYSARVSFTTLCPMPVGLTATDATSTSATLSWSAVPGSTGYLLQWKPSATSVWTTISNTSGTAYNIVGLIPGTNYMVQVQAACTNNSSGYAPAINFVTACGATSKLGTANITNTTALLSWAALPGAKSYTLQWKQTAASAWTTISNLANSFYNLTGCKPATSYTFKVLVVCTNNSSSYSPTFTFTTTAPFAPTVSKFIGRIDERLEQLEKANDVSIVPNPVTDGKATVSYHLAQEGKLVLKVVDVFGRPLKNVPLGTMAAGDHNYTFHELGSLASGFYIIVLEQGNKVIARKQFLVGN
jgi:Zn-dependent metalloprotease